MHSYSWHILEETLIMIDHELVFIIIVATEILEKFCIS